MRGLDHTNIVSAIADGEQQGLMVLLDKLDNQRLL